MTTNIACSVCHAAITPGATVCPGCGLPLVAQAVPVVQPRKSIWPVILGVFGVFFGVVWIAAAISDQIDGKQQSELKASLLSDLQSGRLNTPAAFESRCGMPGATKVTKAGTELNYDHTGDFVTFGTWSRGGIPVSGEPHFQHENTNIDNNGKVETYRFTADPAIVFNDLGCR